MTFAVLVDTLHSYVDQLTQFQALVGKEGMVQQAKTLQYFFNQTLWPQVSQLEFSPAQWQSATTEMHRHMRLLAVEVSFVQSARHSQTYQQRLVQIEQRLQQLQGFTRVLITLCKQ